MKDLGWMMEGNWDKGYMYGGGDGIKGRYWRLIGEFVGGWWIGNTYKGSFFADFGVESV